MLQAFQFDFDGPAEVFVTGPKDASQEMVKRLWKSFLPNKVLIFAEESQLKDLATVAPWVEGRGSQGGKPTVYVCRNYTCQLPVTDFDKVLELLNPDVK
jgi:uncharacterized protein YyaL (SSP411 family)